MSVWKQGPRAPLPSVSTPLMQTPRKERVGWLWGRTQAGATLPPGLVWLSPFRKDPQVWGWHLPALAGRKAGRPFMRPKSLLQGHRTKLKKHRSVYL